MQRIIALIVSAIAVIQGYKETIRALKEENASLRANDDADKAAIGTEKAKNTDLENQISEADAKADELARAIEAEPMVPNVDTDFNITGNEDVIGLSDPELAARARDRETRGLQVSRDPNLPYATRQNISRQQAEGSTGEQTQGQGEV